MGFGPQTQPFGPKVGAKWQREVGVVPTVRMLKLMRRFGKLSLVTHALSTTGDALKLLLFLLSAARSSTEMARSSGVFMFFLSVVHGFRPVAAAFRQSFQRSSCSASAR